MTDKANSQAINRRSVLLGVGGALAGGNIIAKKQNALATPAVNKGITQLTLSMSWPKRSPGPALAAQFFADQVGMLSDGVLEVKLFGAGELVPGLEVFDAVANETVDMAHTAAFYWQGKFPAAAFFTSVPFGMSPLEHQAWLNDGGGLAHWRSLYRDFNILPLAAGNTGMHMAGWFTEPVTRLEDLKGRKLRMAGLGARIYEALGATTLLLPPAELTTALASGLVDGVEFLGPWIDSGFGFEKYANYYYGSGFTKPNGTSELLLSAKRFNALSATHQQIIEAAAAVTNEVALATANWQNASHLNQLHQKVTISPLPEEISQAAAKIAPELIRDAMKEDALSLKIYDAYYLALRQLRAWTNLNS